MFPNGYSELTVSLIDSMKEAFGEEGLSQLLAVRDKKQQQLYLDRMEGAADLRQRLERLADIRSNEGYMAELQEQADGTVLFVEKHCPICEAAAACTELCRNELSLFRNVLGDQAEVERIEHLLSDGARCIYKVSVAGGNGLHRTPSA